jgi:hypothetical protein
MTLTLVAWCVCIPLALWQEWQFYRERRNQ